MELSLLGSAEMEPGGEEEELHYLGPQFITFKQLEGSVDAVEETFSLSTVVL